jgi:F0F1-type ATP synthase delta subunit
LANRQGIREIDSDFTNFVKVLTRKNRFDCLPAVSAAAQKLHNNEIAGGRARR